MLTLEDMAKHACEASGAIFIGIQQPLIECLGVEFHRDKYNHLVLHKEPEKDHEYLIFFEDSSIPQPRTTLALFSMDFNRENIRTKIKESKENFYRN